MTITCGDINLDIFLMEGKNAFRMYILFSDNTLNKNNGGGMYNFRQLLRNIYICLLMCSITYFSRSLHYSTYQKSKTEYV